MMLPLKRRYLLGVLLSIVALVSAEIGVRVLGFVDFPLFDADALIGYVPSANQQGSFRNRNHWQFNAQHMEAPPFVVGPDLDVLLVGDSLVYGGNSYRESERLGALLQAQLEQHSGGHVWPIGAGSWSLRNELTWLGQNTDVVKQVDRIVFVLNSSDFDAASSWSCELTHPRTSPRIALWYLLNKYIYSFENCGTVPAGLQVQEGDLREQLRNFLVASREQPIFVLYPSESELNDPALRAKNFLAGLNLLKDAGGRYLVDVASDGQWSDRYYKDTFHPTADGNRVLSAIIFRALELPAVEPASPYPAE